MIPVAVLENFLDMGDKYMAVNNMRTGKYRVTSVMRVNQIKSLYAVTEEK